MRAERHRQAKYMQVNACRTAQKTNTYRSMRAERHRQAKYMQVNACRTVHTDQINTNRSIQIAGQGFADTEACLFIKSHCCSVFGGYLQCYRQSPSFAKIVKGKG